MSLEDSLEKSAQDQNGTFLKDTERAIGSEPLSNGFRKDFAHLHLHSVYSLLDGAIRIKDLVKEVKALGMKSVAVTDHGNMFGAIDFFQNAKKEGIKPILGFEAYVAPGSRFEKRNAEKIADGKAYHLVLLAKNATGYKNLIKLTSRSYTEGYYYKPRIDYELLAQHSEGLVGLTACLAGEVNRRLYQKETEKAEELSLRLNEIFGQGNFFLEIQNHGIPEQIEVARGAYELSRKTGIPMVLTNDAHFLRRTDQKAQEILLRIQLQKSIHDPLEFGFNEEFYVKSPSEMARLFPDIPSAFNNTTEIADMSDLDMSFGNPLLPDFETPPGMSLGEYLEKIAYDGLKEKFHEYDIPPEYKERLQYELDVIRKMGFEGYFLIVADFISFAKRQGIPVGPGRGSAVGSLVSYCLGITNLDPLKYYLLFERFLNPSRNEMPDIDIDFCRDRREEVINYVIEKYGEDRVSQIITFNTLSAKAVVKDVARVLGVDYNQVNALTKNMPDTPGITLSDAVKQAPPEVRDFFAKDEQTKMLYQVALTLEGVPRNMGKHAAGVVIAPRPLEEIIPLAKDNKDGAIISQYDKGPLEKVGLVKMDFLGLKNLTVIKNCINEIEARRGIKLDIDKLPLDDPKPYELLQKGLTKGIFQVESTGITRLLTQAKPAVFEDIVACIALYRPGPLESGMTESYVKRKNGEEKVIYPHESLKDVLKDTFGTIVYQEQIMLISQIAGGFTMPEADTLRKAMGKKQKDVMEKMRQKFIEGAVERKYQEKWAGDLFDSMAKFAEYGFNKSHSAAYGLITYQTAYLKAHYTIEFLKASMDADIEDTDKLIGYIHHAGDLGVEILPPDINESRKYFTVIDANKIRYGLLGIKGLGASPVEYILSSREKGPFKSIGDFAERVEQKYVNKKMLEALIMAGAYDSLKITRSSLFASVDEIARHAEIMQRDKATGQESLFGTEETGHSILRIENLTEWEDKIKLKKERETLGLYLTSHPLREYADRIKYSRIEPIESIDDGSSERKISIMGVIEEIRAIEAKKSGKTIRIIKISDLTGQIEVRIFENLYAQIKELIAVDEVVILEVRAQIFREEQVKIMLTALSVSAVHSIDDKISKSLHLLVPPDNQETMKSVIREIKQILKKFNGNNPVYIHWKELGNIMKSYRVHGMYFVKHSEELTRALTEIIKNPVHIVWRVGSEMRTSKGNYKIPV